MLKKLASSSPPIPPDHNPPQRAPRRLQLRPPAPLATGFDDDEGSDSCMSIQPRGHIYLQNAFPSDDSAESTETNSSEDALVITTPHSSSHEVARHGLLKPQKKPTRTKSAPVQTTINLSTKSTFEECKVCRIVYNPLHPPDVKFHTKQHKANMRSLSRA
jgi:acetyltransferase ESCO-like protein